MKFWKLFESSYFNVQIKANILVITILNYLYINIKYYNLSLNIKIKVYLYIK